jgi:diamine N-acetyltransferase
MANFDPDNEVEEFRCGIWRLNVAADAQGRGVGRFAGGAVAEEARRRGNSRLTVLWEIGRTVPRTST